MGGNNFKNIIIDKEFQELLLPLDGETYCLLEASIFEHGMLSPLVVWDCDDGSILIDGYNRYSICMEHSIPYENV